MMKRNKKLKGFSFIEVMVAVFIFSLIMTIVVAVFANVIKNQRLSKKIQTNLENIRFAQEYIAKNIRMSTVDGTYGSGAESEVFIFNHSQSKCIRYRFANNTIEESSVSISNRTAGFDGSLGTADDADCSQVPYGSSSALISSSNSLSGNFYVVQSSSTALGKVVISMKVDESYEMAQTTVSLRDY